MYIQHAIAAPAITQFILDDVFRTNLAANGIEIACPKRVRGNTISVIYYVRELSFIVILK
jgi:hypothetical protein